jgi:hypothetical protein
VSADGSSGPALDFPHGLKQSLIAPFWRSIAIGLEQLSEVLYYVWISQKLSPVCTPRRSFRVAHRVERKKAVIALHQCERRDAL